MQINKAVFLNVNGIPVLTVNGICTVGHKRRMNEVEIEGPTFIGENSAIEVKKIGAFTRIGKDTLATRVANIGRFSTIGDACRIGEQFRIENTRMSNSYVLVAGSEPWYQKVYNWDKGKLSSVPKREAVTIGNDVWIGNNVTIFEGSSIGDGCIINSGSVVKDHIPPFSIVENSNIVGIRFERDVVKLIESVAWWNLSIDVINKINKNNFLVELQEMSGNKMPLVSYDRVVINSEEKTVFVTTPSNDVILYKIEG